MKNHGIIGFFIKVNWRVGWLKQQAEAKRKELEALEKERVAYAQVGQFFIVFSFPLNLFMYINEFNLEKEYL